jgi:DNA-binding NarL/FixJ family response regulator
MTIRVAIADDQQLFLKSLSVLIENFNGIQVVAEALNGSELLNKLAGLKELPDILLVDVNMPVMDGVQTVQRVSELYPSIRCAALSIKDDDTTVISMIKAGCCSYLLKDIHPADLEKALGEIYTVGYYNADIANINYRRLIINATKNEFNISVKERAFLKLACSDLTYQQIAAEMHLSAKTIDGYRASLFEKLNVKSRVGLALEALKLKIIQI